MQQHGSKYFALRPPSPTLGMGSIGQDSIISEHGHVAYQIKENHKCSNMVANILPADPPPPPTLGSICQNTTFSEHGHVAYQIKGNHQMQQRGSKYFARRSLPDPTVGVKIKHGHVAYQIKENHKCSNMMANICPQTPTDPGDGVKTQLYHNMVMLHVKLKGIMNALTW